MDDDLDYLDGEVDLDDGIKVIKAPEVEINFTELCIEEYFEEGCMKYWIPGWSGVLVKFECLRLIGWCHET